MTKKLLLILCLWFVSTIRIFSQSQEAETTSTGSFDYALQPSDLINVKIFKEEELEREVRVSREYTITLPLIGRIDVKNKSIRQAEEIIRELYDKDYLVNPQINIVVVEYSKRTVNVIGAVNTPGAVPFPQEQGLTLVDAISRAGGFSRVADMRNVKLTRTAPDGKKTTYIINVSELISSKASIEWPLLPNDVVYVPERIV